MWDRRHGLFALGVGIWSDPIAGNTLLFQLSSTYHYILRHVEKDSIIYVTRIAQVVPAIIEQLVPSGK